MSRVLPVVIIAAALSMFDAYGTCYRILAASCASDEKDDRKDSKAEKLAKELEADFQKQIKGLKFTEDASEKLKSLIDKGVSDVGKDADNPDKVKLAEANLKKFSLALRERAIEKNAEITFSDIRDILKGLCPLYPFCD
jgi:hypothetical protein